RIFAKIANFLRQLGNALRGRGFMTVEDVFERAASGEIGARFREGPPAGATTVDPDTGRPVSRFEGREALASVDRERPGFQPFTDEDGVVRFHAGLPFGKLWDWWLGPFFAKHWHTFGRLPGGKSAYMRPRRKTQGRIDEFDQLARDIYQKLGAFDGATLEKVFEYLTTAGASADMVPQPARVVAADVKKLINEMSHELLWRGAISQAQFDAYKDSYLPQLYLKHVLEEGMI